MRTLLAALVACALVSSAQAQTIQDYRLTISCEAKPTTWLTVPTGIGDQWPENPTVVTFWHLPNSAPTAQAETIDREASGVAATLLTPPVTTWLTLPTKQISDQWPENPTVVTFWHLPNSAPTAQAETIDREASGVAATLLTPPVTTWLTLPTKQISDQWPENPTVVTFWHLPNSPIYGSPNWLLIPQELRHIAALFPGR